MAKIALFEAKKSEEAYLRKRLKGHDLTFIEGPFNRDIIPRIKDSEIVSVFIHSKIDQSSTSKLKKLKLIATRSTGYDHIKPGKGIMVCNVPSYGENTVAEHTFALILSLSRNIHKSYVRTLSGDYSIDGLAGFDLKGKTLGIIGGGHIGMHVARMARAFGIHVRVFDLNRQGFMAEVLNFTYADFDDILKTSDIITFHVPYNRYTHHLLNKKNIKEVKKGAVVINTSRGAVIDTDALLQGLESKRIAGAGLDVIEGEELIQEEHELLHGHKNQEKWKAIVRAHKIFQMDNVVFTPHNAFNSNEALQRILDSTVGNIRSFLEGKPQNIVLPPPKKCS